MRNLGGIGLLLTVACRGAAPRGDEQARSDSAVMARTWGLAYLQQHQLPRAEAEFRKVVTLAPDQPLGYANLGLVYLREGRYREAEAQLRRAAALDSTNSDVGLMLAGVYEATGRDAEALWEVERVRHRDSTDIRALYALAELARRSLDSVDRQRREGWLRQVVARAPANVVARLELVDLLLARGSAGAAAGELEALQRQLPQLPREAARFFADALRLARAGRAAEAATQARLFHRAMEVTAAFGDFDNDGRLDLYVATAGRGVLLQNAGRGRFRDVAAAGLAESGAARQVLFADLDHDGDLDLFLATATGNRVYRNNLDGTFREMAAQMGLAMESSRDAKLGDFDGDGHSDLLVVGGDGSTRLFRNLGQGRFQDVTAASGLAAVRRAGAVAVGDYDNDGFLDLFFTSLDGTDPALYHNRGDGTFERDARTDLLRRTLPGVAGLDAAFFDFDNDGRLDLIVVGKGGVRLFCNDATRGFEDLC